MCECRLSFHIVGVEILLCMALAEHERVGKPARAAAGGEVQTRYRS